MAEKHLNQCSISLASREMQIKLLSNSIFYLSVQLRSKTQGKTHLGENVDQGKHSSIGVGVQDYKVTLEINMMVSFKIAH